MTDVIRIRGLHVKTHIGVTDVERSNEQVVVIDIDIHTDLSTASSTDNLDHTVDYGSTIAEVVALVRSHEARLLEHLAEKIAELVTTNKLVDGVTVEIAKEDPPVGEDVDAVAVRIERP